MSEDKKQKFTKFYLWRLLSSKQKEEFTEKYKIKASGKKDVRDNRLVRDGIMEGDVEGIPMKELLKASNVEERLKNTKKDKEEKDDDVKSQSEEKRIKEQAKKDKAKKDKAKKDKAKKDEKNKK